MEPARRARAGPLEEGHSRRGIQGVNIRLTRLGRAARARGVILAALALPLLVAGCGDGERAEGRITPGEFSAPTPPANPRTTTEIFPETGRRGLVLNNCASCHAVACVALGQRNRQEWAAVEATHRGVVPGLSLEDSGKIFDYLYEHFNDRTPEPVVPREWLNGDCEPANPR